MPDTLPTASAGASTSASEDIDFDDLSRRFEELKKIPSREAGLLQDDATGSPRCRKQGGARKGPAHMEGVGQSWGVSSLLLTPDPFLYPHLATSTCPAHKRQAGGSKGSSRRQGTCPGRTRTFCTGFTLDQTEPSQR